MPNYRVEYETWNAYENHVGDSFFVFQVLPCSDEIQSRNQYHFTNSLDEPVYVSKNHYGFDQIILRTVQPFRELRIHLSCDVHVGKSNPFEISSRSIAEETAYLDELEFQIEHHAFLKQTSYTEYPIHSLSKDWHKRDEEHIFDYLQRVNSKIHTDFEYTPNVTDVHHSAADTIEIKKGVCQDFAHIFITIARLNKIPCRYVAGYLNQGVEFIGNVQMHAWVEAYIPFYGWVGFDPTNNILKDHHYIKVCHGIDYSECGSIKGILKTVGDQKTEYAVKVIQQ